MPGSARVVKVVAGDCRRLALEGDQPSVQPELLRHHGAPGPLPGLLRLLLGPQKLQVLPALPLLLQLLLGQHLRDSLLTAIKLLFEHLLFLELLVLATVPLHLPLELVAVLFFHLLSSLELGLFDELHFAELELGGLVDPALLESSSALLFLAVQLLVYHEHVLVLPLTLKFPQKPVALSLSPIRSLHPYFKQPPLILLLSQPIPQPSELPHLNRVLELPPELLFLLLFELPDLSEHGVVVAAGCPE